MKKELQKNLSFVLFVMAVFFAGMSLTVFQSYIWMACIAGVLLLATTVFYVLSKDKDTSSPMEKTSDILLADRMAELMRGKRCLSGLPFVCGILLFLRAILESPLPRIVVSFVGVIRE